MIYLLLGLAIWWAAHLLKRLAPNARASIEARMGSASQGLFAALIVISIVLMVIGYKAAAFIPVWYPPSFFGHINNLLMILAFYTFGASAAKPAKVWLGTKLRHPQLTAFKIWAVAHLLANGDMASIILFGGLLAWAVVEVIVINRQDGPWTPPERAPMKKEVTLLVITVVLFVLVSAIHIWAGVNPFGGV